MLHSPCAEEVHHVATPQPLDPVPEDTARVARAAFPKGNPYLTLRDQFGIIFQDEDFTALFPACGQPGLSPWRLALVTILQFRETLADRQAAEAVRARIHWKYLPGLELTDPGFDFSVLSEFRSRLLAGHTEGSSWRSSWSSAGARGLLKARGQQRTDATHVLAAIRVLNRLELVAETLRAALNGLATVAPDWCKPSPRWHGMNTIAGASRTHACPPPRRNARRMPRRWARMGSACWTHWTLPRSAGGRELPVIETLRRTWQRHYERLQTRPRRMAHGSSPGALQNQRHLAPCRREH